MHAQNHLLALPPKTPKCSHSANSSEMSRRHKLIFGIASSSCRHWPQTMRPPQTTRLMCLGAQRNDTRRPTLLLSRCPKHETDIFHLERRNSGMHFGKREHFDLNLRGFYKVFGRKWMVCFEREKLLVMTLHQVFNVLSLAPANITFGVGWDLGKGV